MFKSNNSIGYSKSALMGRLMSMTAVCGSLALTAVYAAPANAQAQEQRFQINIATGPLADGLRSIQMQTGAKIAFSPQQMRDTSGHGLAGSFTAAEAIQHLLEGTSFAVKSSDHAMFVVSSVTSGAIDPGPLFIRAAAVSTVDAPVQTAAAAPSTPAPADIDEIVVTGTQILRDGYESPTPLTVVGVKDFEAAAPNNLSDYLGKMPALAGSTSPRSTANSVSDGNGGVAALNLRFLGANRTLILLDGMRVGPSTENGASTAGEVDVNEFPDALVKRVDVVTGGASGAYGSDALAGVVNFVLDKEFVGVKGSVQSGITTYGDDMQYAIAVTGGAAFANGKGHALLSVSHRYTDGILHGSVRSWVADAGWDIIQTPGYTTTNGMPFYTVSRFVGSGLYASGGLIAQTGLPAGSPLFGTIFGPGGVPSKFQYGALNAGNANMIGGDWRATYPALTDTGEQYTTSLDDRLSRQNFFGRVSYDLTDHVQVFATFMYSHSAVLSYCCTSDNLITIKSGNPFIPASVQAQMTALKVTQFTLGTLNLEIGAVGPENTRQKGFFATGANGDFDLMGSNWKWNVFASRSLMRIADKAINSPIKAVVDQSSDVVTDPRTGYPICRSTLTNPSDGCVPYNPMGVGVNSPSVIKSVLGGTSRMWTRILQDDFGGVLRAEPFSLPAGPVSLALGVEHRYTGSYGYAPPTDIASGFFLGNYHPTVGNLADTEGFVETVIPLAKDAAWTRAVDLNAAFRVTNYTLMGAVTTYKVGATWDGPDGPLEGIRLRATRSRDIRAPSLGDLFAGGRVGQGAQIDPFIGASVPNVLSPTIGNPKLTPEIANQTGVGAVYSPSWFPGFDMSFDAFWIDIKNVIASTAAQNVINACYAGNQTYCPFVIRGTPTTPGALGPLLQIISAPANTAFEKENGFDIEASYRKNLADISDSWSGNITLRMLATKIAKQDTTDALGNVVRLAGQNIGGVPTWTYNLNAGYDADVFAITWTGRGISAGKRNNFYTECKSGCAVLTPPRYTVNDNYMPAAFYHDVNLTYRMKDIGGGDAELFVGVENLTDNNPDDFFVHNSNALYDRLGRIFRGGVRFKM